MKPTRTKRSLMQWILSSLKWPWRKGLSNKSLLNQNNNELAVSIGYNEVPHSMDLSFEEKQLMWKFRSCLKSNPRALIKFIRSIDWQAEVEIEEAMKVVMEWESVGTCDALELLGPSFRHPFVRCYAISQLKNAKSVSVLLYLPQLVQALRYENDISCAKLPMIFGSDPMDLFSFLIQSACSCANIATFLYWYLKVEIEANAQKDKTISLMYGQVMLKLKETLAKGNKRLRRTLLSIERQKKFVDALVEMAKLAAEGSGNRVKRLDVLKMKLIESNEFAGYKGLCLPLDPSIRIKNIHVESTILYASNMMPMRLTFNTINNQAYTTIFKRGDDLRQDQLISQMIRLMDSLLKEKNLDLRLTSYSVLATGVSDGFVQFVEATPLADLKNIQEALRSYGPSSTAPFGVSETVLDNYVKSCAGYSIICYILGVGDRHLHNLLLRDDGRMFHVDFGYILGRDPKLMPPPMKLTYDMVNAMGGRDSEYFKQFVIYCSQAFCILRINANLISNLFSLMLDSGIPDIAADRDKTVQTVIERFHLQLSDEEACRLVHRLIMTSISAKIPLIVDFVHDVKQFMSS